MSTGLAYYSPEFAPHPIYRLAQILDPSPTQTSVFLDEDEWSIQNGALGILPPDVPAYYYWNLPGSRHNRASTLSFADGHSEVWHWLDPYIGQASETIRSAYLASPSNYSPQVGTVAGDRDLRRVRNTVAPKR